VQAQLPGDVALERVLLLERDPAFTLKNPNRVQALLGAFVRGNPSGFHRIDGAGYRLLAERLVTLDALNSQLAARLATAFNGWQRLEQQRREAARSAIAGLTRHGTLSRNLAEIIGNVLNH
jgi:aminopeptidase N